MEKEKSVLTAKEAAEALRITYNQMLQLLKSQSIPYLKLGKSYRISAKVIQGLIETKKPIELDVV